MNPLSAPQRSNIIKGTSELAPATFEPALIKLLLPNMMMKRLLIIISITLTAIARTNAATWYVDTAATGSNNGTSWANAWTSISSATGSSVAPGDTVYISNGSYANFNPKSGTVGNPITYKIGQQAGHNGTVTFTGSGTWLSNENNLIISGDAGDGQMHFATSGYGKIVDTPSTHFRL
jgi:T5SS/PEP-CTERM-associated repeat protein